MFLCSSTDSFYVIALATHLLKTVLGVREPLQTLVEPNMNSSKKERKKKKLTWEVDIGLQCGEASVTQRPELVDCQPASRQHQQLSERYPLDQT